MTEEQLLKRLGAIQKEKNQALAHINVLAGQEVEVKHWIEQLKKPEGSSDGRPRALPPSGPEQP